MTEVYTMISMKKGATSRDRDREFSDIPYAGLFGDTVIARVVEEIIADPHSSYRPRELEELTGASAPSVRDALVTLTRLGLLVSSGGKHPVYTVDTTRKTFVALTLLAYAVLDDREMSDCMHTALVHYCETTLVPAHDGPAVPLAMKINPGDEFRLIAKKEKRNLVLLYERVGPEKPETSG
jgi:hypothetical protein